MNTGPLLYRIVRSLCACLLKIFFPYEVRGRQNADNLNGGYIICSNHLSNIDAVFLVASRKNQICFMAKAELFSNKLLGKFFESLGAFSVNRGNDNGKALKKAKEILESKKTLGIFIEGTRSKTGEFLRPRSGVSMLAYNTGVPILPVCITGVGKNKIKIFRKTVVLFGNPIYPDELEVNSGTYGEYRQASRLIMSRIKQLREINNNQ